jgi:hypothetical protein
LKALADDGNEALGPHVLAATGKELKGTKTVTVELTGSELRAGCNWERIESCFSTLL